MLVILRIAIWLGRNAAHLRSQGFQQVGLLVAEVVRYNEQAPVALGEADEREPDAGVARRAFDDCSARPEDAATFGVLDERECGPFPTDPPGFMNSALPRISQPVSSDSRRSRINGVFPTYPSMPEYVALMRSNLGFQPDRSSRLPSLFLREQARHGESVLMVQARCLCYAPGRHMQSLTACVNVDTARS